MSDCSVDYVADIKVKRLFFICIIIVVITRLLMFLFIETFILSYEVTNANHCCFYHHLYIIYTSIYIARLKLEKVLTWVRQIF